MAAKKPAKLSKMTKKKTVTRTTAVRNTPIPKVRAVAKAASNARGIITHEMIAERAYLISLSSTGGSETDNWYRAERELRGGI